MRILRVKHLSYQNRGPYTFTVPGGQCYGLSGASGSGKTLLLRSLADLDVHAGRVSLGDIVCHQVPAPQWRKRVGMLPAESCWWFDSVGEHFNVEVGELEEVLLSLGFERDVMNWQIHRLSTGEKQRLAIARLLANSPQALLLDEPTASLDSLNIERVENMLMEYCRDKMAPLLWVSHDMDQLGRVSGHRMIMQSDGLLV